ncbi:MAG: flagellar basal body L-ring protein FlgH [Planctomycetota bacterium]|jgi:flagellar L-ring protein precursor FlgH|nr:flagellar basal body L-ring protein FlgH [Planctomycetota bacterium]MDP6502441.1 flagellar basal body L-ring protein FlgH [Planctomycetota bacterium]
MNYRNIAIFSLLCLFTLPANADSLWKRKTPDARLAMWTTRRAMLVGDIVTILIQESSEASDKEQFARTRSNSNNAELDYELGPFGEDGGSLNFQSTKDVSAQHEDETEKSLTTRLSAIVKEQLFNGNLIIEAQRELIVQDEITTIIVSGIIRPDDIRGDNTILSENIAEAQIRFEGKGNVGEVRKKGRFGTRILDFVIPF